MRNTFIDWIMYLGKYTYTALELKLTGFDQWDEVHRLKNRFTSENLEDPEAKWIDEIKGVNIMISMG